MKAKSIMGRREYFFFDFSSSFSVSNCLYVSPMYVREYN
jgi:hypothetical protein